ncbi:MAG TPA: glycosyltransferase [Chitinophagaceae bacterium]|nr:glycosyltransferase [Chitinophagaceae bacterium]
MKFSVIIPACNAADTISATLDSLLAQTYGHWQAVIVDDGSTDATPSIAHKYCADDNRFSLVRQSNSGLSAARNTGIAAAKHTYLLFLDADDWIAPSFFEKFAHTFDENPGIDALVCGWHFTLEDGSVADSKIPPVAEDMFPFFSHTCPFVVHSCVINRRVIENAGVFDSTVGFVEDWDFWQRVSRTGARFKLIREVLAYYRMRKGSLSRKVNRSYHDARQMIFQGYTSDQRVSYPVTQYEKGMPDNNMNEHLCWLYCWYAGLCIGVGETIEQIPVPELSEFEPDPQLLADYIFEAVYRGGCFLPGQWLRFYLEHRSELENFFELVAEKTAGNSVIRDSKVRLLSMIIQHQSSKQIHELGEVVYWPMDVHEPVTKIRTQLAKIILGVWMDGVELGKIEVLRAPGILSTQAVKQLVGEQFAWPIMTSYLKHRHPELPDDELEGGRGWELFLQELWGINCTEAELYDKSYVDNSEYDTRSWEDVIRVDVEKELFHIRNEFRDVNIVYYVGGLELGRLSIQGDEQVVKAHMVRAAISAHAKFELCKAAVIQGLIGKDPGHLRMREELQNCGREI